MFGAHFLLGRAPYKRNFFVFTFGQATNFCKVVDFVLGQAKNFCTVVEILFGRQSYKKKRSYRDSFYNYAFLTISNQSVS
jgi:hypothetical protein